MSRIQVINRTYQEMTEAIAQAEQLASKASLTPQEVRLHTTLLAKISMLKAGISSDELRRAEMERIAKLGGFESPEAVLNQKHIGNNAAYRDWHDFHKYGERRSDDQSTAQWGRPSGEDYTDAAGDGTGTQGGYLVPADYDVRLFSSLADYDEILRPEYSNVWMSARGSAAKTPAVDDTSGSPLVANKSTIVAETVQGTVKPVRFTGIDWSATPTYRTGIVLVASELEQDAFMPMFDMLEAVFERRHRLAFGNDVCNGSGNPATGGTPTTPLGIRTNLPSGTAITSASSTLALADLENTYNALPKIYRDGAVWYMSDTTRNLVTKLMETSGRPMVGGSAEELLRKPIAVCHSFPDWSAGQAGAIVFANPRYLIQRRVSNKGKDGAWVKQFRQTPGYIENGVIGYQGYLRADFRPILFDSAIPPVASLNAHA